MQKPIAVKRPRTRHTARRSLPERTEDTRSGQGGFAHRIAGNPAMPHDPRLAHIPWRGLMKQAAVVPNHGVAGPPLVVIDARWTAGEINQLLQQPLRLILIHVRDVVGMAADYQRLSTRFRMNLNQWPQGHGTIVETITAILAALLGMMTKLCLTIKE